MNTKLLESVGLTNYEATVYLSLLRLGTSKTGAILKDAGLNTGKIYEILEGLKTKGLASESIINNVRHFTAAKPSKILEFIENKQKKIDEEKKTISKILPELNNISESNFLEPKAITYTGFNGFKTAVMECYGELKKGEEMLGMGIASLEDKKIDEFWMEFSYERIAKGVRVRLLFAEDKSRFARDFKKFKHTEVRILEGITPVTVSIFGENKTLITNYMNPMTCTLIYDKYTVDSFRVFFEGLWEKARIA